ncbi:MAG: hypothetical protein GY842_18480 [bacterium]|nr:hypothetical protein [bacterium]
MRRAGDHQRGTGYVAVLGMSMLITVIGLSALMATRIQHRGSEGSRDAGEARICAQSMVNLGVALLDATPTWRADYANDQWVSAGNLGSCSGSFKLVDPVDDDLADDRTQPARLYGRGVVGEAVRTYSVVIAGETAAGSMPNLLTNGGFEDGLTGWMGDYCDLEATASNPHSGSACLRVWNRTGWAAGPWQDVTSELVEGATYSASAWAKTRSSSEDLWLVLWVLDDRGWWWEAIAVETVGKDAWTEISGSFTPFWNGTLVEASWKVESDWSNQEFMLDDAELVLESAGGGVPTIEVVPGSWRREVY